MHNTIFVYFREVRLTPVSVDGEVSILRELCGKDDFSAISWLEEIITSRDDDCFLLAKKTKEKNHNVRTVK
jgi:hypothetical protein